MTATEIKTLTNNTLAETLYVAQLPSGLRVLVLPRKGFAKKFASFAVNYGSIDHRFRLAGERDWIEVPDGIAHFLEHQLFAQEYGDAFEKFSELGASANAFTTYHATSYLFSATDNFFENFELLLDFVQTPYFTDQGTEKERGIIIQEINMYRDRPGWRLNQNLREALFVKHPFRIDIAGSIDSVQQITTEMLRTCYRTFYRPDNMVVSVVGDVDPEQVIEFVAHNAAKHPHEKLPPIERSYEEEPVEVARTRVEEHMTVAHPMVAVGFKDYKTARDGREVIEREFLTDIALQVLFGTASEFYSRLYEEGVIDESFRTSYYGEASFGMTTLAGVSSQPEKLYDAILKVVRHAIEHGLPEDEVERVRRSMYGEMVGVFDSLDSISYLLNNGVFRGVSIFEPLSVLEEIDVEKVNGRVREHFQEQLHALSLVTP